MLANTLDIAVGGVTKTLNRINQDGYGSEYFLNDGTSTYTLRFSHTIPAKGSFGESHLVRLDRAMYDGSGVLLRTISTWIVIKTFDGIQVDADAEDTAEALIDLMTDANVAKVIDRES